MASPTKGALTDSSLAGSHKRGSTPANHHYPWGEFPTSGPPNWPNALSSPGGGKLSPEALGAHICFSMGMPTTWGTQSKSFRKYRHLGVFVLFRNSTKGRVFSIQLRASGNHIILFLSNSFSLNWVWITQVDTILVDVFIFWKIQQIKVFEELFHYYHEHSNGNLAC